MIDFDTAARNINAFLKVINGKEPERNIFTSSGFKVDPLKCRCCGGNIDVRSLTCPFCDTSYSISIDEQTPVAEKAEQWTRLDVMSPNEIREHYGIKNILNNALKK